MTEGATTYYAARWATEVKANLWAMHRAGVILQELSLLDVKEPNVVDFGCGTGWFTSILSQFGYAQGVDLAPDAAREFHPRLRFYRADELPEGPFDVVVSQEVLEHADNQDEYVTSAFRLLRPGGFLILTTPNATISLRHPEFLVQPVEKHLTASQLRTMLEKRSEIVKLYSFFYGYGRWPWRLQMRFGRLLNQGLHLIAVCRKRDH